MRPLVLATALVFLSASAALAGPWPTGRGHSYTKVGVGHLRSTTLVAPGSPATFARFSGWLTARRMFETTRGFVSSSMSMMRAAPTRGPLAAMYCSPDSSWLNSSTSTRYLRPSIVTGIATCGIVMFGHTRRLTSRT